MLRRLHPPFPTRRLAIAAAALAPVWLLSGSRAGLVAAIVATVVLALVVAVEAWLIPARWAVEVERELPASVGITDRADGVYRLRSRWPRALRFALYDQLPRGIAHADTGGATAPARGVLEAREELPLPVAITGRERGVWPLGPLALRVEGPLRLLQRTLRAEPGDRITVTPSLAGVRSFRLLTVQHRMRDMGVRAMRRRGEGTSFSSLREYVPGDDPRRIDWKASARRGELISREFTVEQGQTVMIAVDAGRMMTQLAGALPRFEYALSSALVLADVAASSDDRVGLIVFDDEVRAFVPPAAGLAALSRIRDALVPLTARLVEPDYALAFRTLAARQRRRSLIVLFTDVIDARASQALIAHTARSAARHLPVVVALRNEQLLAAATPRPGMSTEALYESAAAEELLLARDDALARMRHAGVSVLDVPVEAMTAAVVNRYLELKARAAV
ncbi:MAG TPA: DUF58 domain-containing protein [Gemmatimonadaceae bacterium]|nr:DUF58 domain-containing protein [Gemmatimonadaceae bacterium]